MAEELKVGDRVQVFLLQRAQGGEGWFEGTVVRIDPYSQHRSFHWVELDAEAIATLGIRLISVLNPRNIRKV